MDLYDQQFIYNIDGLLTGPARLKQNRDQDGELSKQNTFSFQTRLECFTQI
jgi:hypothetical protein